MNALERDLIRWESGELTLDDVEAAHPDVGIRELVRMHTRLSMLRAIPMPDVERAWTMTVSRLDDRRPAMSDRFRTWARKPLIASFASVVMTGGAAYAAGVDPVERAVDRAWAGLSRIVARDSRDARDVAAENERETATEVTPTETAAPIVESTEPPGDDADGEHGKSKTKGNSEDHRKDEENKHRGWVNKKDKEKKDKTERPFAGTPEEGGGSDKSAPASSNGNGPERKDDSPAHSEAADDSAAPAVEEPPAPPAPPANGSAGGNGNGAAKGKDKLRL